MVLLTMTSAMVAAVKKFNARKAEAEHQPQLAGEPDISSPEIGKPISHAQIINIAKCLRSLDSATSSSSDSPSYYLNDLLRGSQVYVAPPKPKAEPTTEFKELMDRLRREEEARSYERMTASTQPSHNPFKQTPSSYTGPSSSSPRVYIDEDEMTFSDVNRQLTLIINVLVSIIACGIGIWLVAWHWKAPARLALSMGGSGVVGVAEVVIYVGYLRRLQDAKVKERSKKEKKTITDTWVIEKSAPQDVMLVDSAKGATGIDAIENTKYRKGRRR